jgi:hypothetical protein
MTIRRLDVFFRTHLILDKDKPNTFNSATNLAFSALQHLVGQKKYQSLQGKVTQVPSAASPASSSYFNTLKKIVIWIRTLFLIIVLTPLGIVARNLSFRSPDVDQAYSLAFFSQLRPLERTSQNIEFSFAFLLKKSHVERTELLRNLPANIQASFLSLKGNQNYANNFLLTLPETERISLLQNLPPSIQGSFLSLEVNRDYSIVFLRQLPDSDFNKLMPHLSSDLIETYLAEKNEKAKKKALDDYLTSAVESLTRLDSKLSEQVLKLLLKEWLEEYRSQPLYPFPFLLAEQLEANTKIKDRADSALWEEFMRLCQLCSKKLEELGLAWNEEKLQLTSRSNAHKTYKSAFKSNVYFFCDLETKLKTCTENSEITKWLEEKKEAYNYYPFYSQPHIIAFMQQQTISERAQSLSKTFETCKTLLKARGIGDYIEEKPPSDHPTVNMLMSAIDQLENIASLQALIKNQIT